MADQNSGVDKPVELDRLEMRLRRLEDALVRYGRHGQGCRYDGLHSMAPTHPEGRCTCGLADLVQQLRKEGRD